ncbi:hypothetical protein IAD21_06093 [Abditibacteriota bacterium]|nr:hypothetical protein IAD21_06093 [Abditibacteriota bacterium]
MTPTEEYTKKRLEAEELIRQYAPARLQEQLIVLLRPAIALTATRADDAQIPIGASKFGGAPDVPEGFEWPMWNHEPLGFLAQISLEEVAPFDVQGTLPHQGLLSFFYDVKKQPSGSSQEKNGWRVFLHTAEIKRASRSSASPCALLNGELRFTLPTDFECFPELGLTINDCLRTGDWALLGELDKFLVPLSNQILGHPNVVQRNPGVEVEGAWRDFLNEGYSSDWSLLEEAADKWLLLFQMSSEEEVSAMWGDVGTIYFMIRPEDLESHNFENVWLTLQCS